MYTFSEGIQVYYKQAIHRQEKLFLQNICKDMNRRIGRISDKVEKITGFIKHKKEILDKEKEKGIVKDDDLFNYDQYFAQQRDQQFMEKQVQELERQELEGLTESLSELAKTFSRMQDLVFEQGAIIDRIDVNLSVTFDQVEAGNRQLQKAIEHQQNGLADAIIKVLAVLVVLMSFALLLKYL